MDRSGVTAEHGKIMFVSGMGFFTDAPDLFIIGVVIAILKTEWHPSDLAVGLVTSTALLASAFGAILFGRVAGMVGRKRIYGVAGVGHAGRGPVARPRVAHPARRGDDGPHGARVDPGPRLLHDGAVLPRHRAHPGHRDARLPVPGDLRHRLLLHGIRPKATTFVDPAELFPVEGRTTGHGIAPAAGKVGGFIGVFLFPIPLGAGGLLAAELVAALVSRVGIAVTVSMLPEIEGKSLEELGAEAA